MIKVEPVWSLAALANMMVPPPPLCSKPLGPVILARIVSVFPGLALLFAKSSFWLTLKEIVPSPSMTA